MNIYMFRRPGQEKAWTIPFFEVGIAVSLLTLVVFVAIHLIGRVRKPA